MTAIPHRRSIRWIEIRKFGIAEIKVLMRAVLMMSPLHLQGCAGILSDMSADGELNEEYRLKNQYQACLKQSAQDGRDCSKIKDDLLQEQQWNAMDGGV